jgi:flagellar hook-associated protein 1 FlgK
VGGEFLVFEGQRREIEVNRTDTVGAAAGKLQFVSTHAPLNTTTGELSGLYAARDEIVGGFLDKLDDLAGTLAFEFNKVYSQGQGLVGFNKLTSVNGVTSTTAALDEAGLAFTPVSGTFDILIRNIGDDPANIRTQTTTISIDLNGLDEDTSLANLAQQINAVDGISASITAAGQLRIEADSTDVDFAFSGDTSGVLAALGLNTFFTGSTAATIGVNAEVKGIDNAGKFAASLGGVGQDSRNAERLAVFMDQPIESAGGATITDLYDQLINQVTQGSSVSQALADGFRTFEASLDGQAQAVSGVSIDEEAVKMMTLQRIYQASAKYIQTISELLDLLVKI